MRLLWFLVVLSLGLIAAGLGLLWLMAAGQGLVP
jgi:hypothetical protein